MTQFKSNDFQQRRHPDIWVLLFFVRLMFGNVTVVVGLYGQIKIILLSENNLIMLSPFSLGIFYTINSNFIFLPCDTCLFVVSAGSCCQQHKSWWQGCEYLFLGTYLLFRQEGFSPWGLWNTSDLLRPVVTTVKWEEQQACKTSDTQYQEFFPETFGPGLA